LAAILAIAVARASGRPRGFPPGPFGLPLVGYLPFLDVRNVGRSFKRLAAKHGEIFSVILGKKAVVVLNSFDSIKVKDWESTFT